MSQVPAVPSPARPQAGPPGGAAPPRRPAALGPLLRLGIRGILGRRRSAGVALLAAAPVLVAAVLAIGGGLGRPEAMASEVFETLTVGLVVPLVALVLGTAVLGTAIDDGTIVYLLAKPIPRRTAILAAMLVATAAAVGLVVPTTLASGLFLLGGGSPGMQAGMVAGAAVATVLYVAVFVTLSVFTGRALVAGLGYVLVWEGLVTTLLTGTRVLSIREYAMSVAGALAEPGVVDPAGVEAPVAVALAIVVVVAAFILGSWRLARFQVTEAG